MWCLPHVGPNVRCTADECRHAPTCEEYSDHHDERDHERRNADGHKLRGCLGGSEPSAGGEAARIPKACKLLRRETSDAGKVSSKLMVVRLALTDPSQDNEPGQKYDQRHPKVDVLQDGRPPPPRLFVFIAIGHQSLPAETFV